MTLENLVPQDYPAMPADTTVPIGNIPTGDTPTDGTENADNTNNPDNIKWRYESPLPDLEDQNRQEDEDQILGRWCLRNVQFPGSVPGWLTVEEGATLALLARGKTVLEIGSYCGRSTVCMAQTAKRVYALDWHRGDPAPGTCPAYATLHYLITAILHYGVEEIVVILAGSSKDVGVALGSGWADMVYVDGAHDYQSVKKDIALALRCLKPDGILALHDWDFTTVRDAARANDIGAGKLIGNKLYIVGGSNVGVNRDILELELKSLEQQKVDIAAQKVELNNREQAVAGAEQMVRHLIAKFDIDRMKADVAAKRAKEAKDSSSTESERYDNRKPVTSTSTADPI